MRHFSPMRGTILLAMLYTIAFSHVSLAQSNDHPRPNVVLIAMDTLRADHLGCYGSKRPTSPCIDKLAGEGVLFEQAYSPASWTLPAFVSIFTGVGPSAHGCVGYRDPIPLSFPPLAEAFKNKGYYCGAVVSNPFLGAKYGFGRGFDQYDDYSVFFDSELASLAADGKPGSPPIVDLVTGTMVTRRASQLLDSAMKANRPFFMFVHYFDPHASYVPPEEFRSRFEVPYDGLVSGRELDAVQTALLAPKDIEQLRRLYDGEIAFDDAQIGQLINTLDAKVDPTNTIMVVLSDHGESFVEHGRCLHGNSAYSEETHIPMIWRWKGHLSAGQRSSALVSSLDIFPTLCDVLSLPQPSDLQGESLTHQLQGSEGRRDRVVVSERACDDGGVGQMKHLAAVGYGLRVHLRFSETPPALDAATEVYDVLSDPLEQQRLSSIPPNAKYLDEALQKYWLQCREIAAKHPSVKDAAVPQSTAELRQLEGLGYTSTAATQATTRNTKGQGR